MVLYPILLSQSWSTTVPNFMLVSGIAQSGQNLALSRLAKLDIDAVKLVQAVYCYKKMTMVLIILFVTILKRFTNIREMTLP